jgi:hypothetical protein
MASIAPPAHTRSKETTDDWITPKWLIERIGPFDLDPCESMTQPWPCAERGINVQQNGLLQPWSGSVWMNPPYGKRTNTWLEKLAAHGNGVALVFARTETRMFFDHVWPHYSAMLFLRGRLTFCFPDGKGSKAAHNSGGPSVLIGYGGRAAELLSECVDLGAIVRR